VLVEPRFDCHALVGLPVDRGHRVCGRARGRRVSRGRERRVRGRHAGDARLSSGSS
jgi:hypothetical protein